MMSDQVPGLAAEKEEAPREEGVERTRQRRAFVPRSDIYETADAIVIVSDMPGVDESTLDLLLEKNVLTISGYTSMTSEGALSLAYAEYEAGDYERRFVLSDQIDQEGINASVKDGVLTVRLPKAKTAIARKIAVNAG
jgi:HSP20 family protein